MPANFEIPYSKRHLYFSFLIFGILYYFPVLDIYKNGFTFDSPNIFLVPISTAMLIYFMVRFGMPTLKGESALELTPTGIIDKVRNRTIYWEDIESLAPGSTSSSSVVIVFLKDASKYRPSNPFGYIPWWLGNLSFGSPVIIGTRFIDIKASDLIQEIAEYQENLVRIKTGNRVIFNKRLRYNFTRNCG